MNNRRAFLQTIIGGVAAGAAVRTWPFRVFSFPENIVIPNLAMSQEDFIAYISPAIKTYLNSSIMTNVILRVEREHPTARAFEKAMWPNLSPRNK